MKVEDSLSNSCRNNILGCVAAVASAEMPPASACERMVSAAHMSHTQDCMKRYTPSHASSACRPSGFRSAVSMHNPGAPNTALLPSKLLKKAAKSRKNHLQHFSRVSEWRVRFEALQEGEQSSTERLSQQSVLVCRQSA